MHARMFGVLAEIVCVDRFQLRRKMGEGASAVVYAAFDPHLLREVALKLILIGPDDEAATLAEARAMAQLRHPNLLPAFDAGTHDGIPYVVTELVEGGTLRDWMAEAHSSDEAFAMLLGIGRGVAEAHRRGLVHRDLKPENILVGDGRPRVGDFGLSRSFGAAAADGGRSSSPLPGTPAYMSPEHRNGLRSDPASDQFSFAVLAHEVCFGVHPFLDAVAHSLAPPSASHPLAFAAPILARGFASDPSARWASVDELLRSLEAAAAAIGRRRRTRAWLMVLVPAAVLAGAAFVVATLIVVGGGPPATAAPAAASRVFSDEIPALTSLRDWDGCADLAERHARSVAETSIWIGCADASTDPDKLDRACAALARLRSGPAIGECDLVRRLARREYFAHDYHACAERVLAAPPTNLLNVVLARCAAEVPREEYARRQCIYARRLAGASDADASCDVVLELDPGKGSGL